MRSKNSFFVYEAQGIAKGVGNIERSLAPRPGFYPGRHTVRTCACLASASMRTFKVACSDVQVVRIRPCIEAVSIGTRIEAGQDYVTAEKVVATRRNPLTRGAQDFRVEGSSPFDIRHGNNNAKDSHRFRAAMREHTDHRMLHGMSRRHNGSAQPFSSLTKDA
jgi:hypothetical protein